MISNFFKQPQYYKSYLTKDKQKYYNDKNKTKKFKNNLIQTLAFESAGNSIKTRKMQQKI